MVFRFDVEDIQKGGNKKKVNYTRGIVFLFVMVKIIRSNG